MSSSSGEDKKESLKKKDETAPSLLEPQEDSQIELKEVVIDPKKEKEKREAERAKALARQEDLPSNRVKDEKFGVGEWIVTILSVFLLIVFFPLTPFIAIRSAKQYARAVVMRLGRLRGAVGPGLFCVIPCTDKYKTVDLRLRTFDVPPQEVLTRDSVTIHVNAVVYYRIHEPIKSVLNVADVNTATHLLAQTTLRNVIGTHQLQDLIAHRETVSIALRNILDEATDPWGVTIDRVELKDIVLPQGMQRAMAAEAEAVRVARGKVVAAGGERLAAKNLRLAADEMMKSPAALQLRYLQTLNSIASERNSTIVFPMPLDGIGTVPRMMQGLAPVLAQQQPTVAQALASASAFMASAQQSERPKVDKYEEGAEGVDDTIISLLTEMKEKKPDEIH